MGDIKPFDIERAYLTPVAGFYDLDRDLPGQIELDQFAAQHFGGERRGIDPALKATPQIGKGA